MKNFRRLALVAILFSLVAVSARADFRFGIKAGVNINNLHLEDYTSAFNSSNRCGFTGGVMAEFTVPVIGIGVDASLMYSRMNSSVESDDTGLVEAIKNTDKNFFEIPINLKYKIQIPAISSFLTPYIFTGPDFAFKLSGDDSYSDTKAVQVAWNVGAGVELVKHVQVGVSYGFGINKIYNKISSSAVTSSDIKAKNNYWTITAAYLF
jgi:hypothetical protein